MGAPNPRLLCGADVGGQASTLAVQQRPVWGVGGGECLDWQLIARALRRGRRAGASACREGPRKGTLGLAQSRTGHQCRGFLPRLALAGGGLLPRECPLAVLQLGPASEHPSVALLVVPRSASVCSAAHRLEREAPSANALGGASLPVHAEPSFLCEPSFHFHLATVLPSRVMRDAWVGVTILLDTPSVGTTFPAQALAQKGAS